MDLYCSGSFDRSVANVSSMPPTSTNPLPAGSIAVVRPTTLVGDFDPLEDERLDGLYLLVLFIVATPAAAAPAAATTITPAVTATITSKPVVKTIKVRLLTLRLVHPAHSKAYILVKVQSGSKTAKIQIALFTTSTPISSFHAVPSGPPVTSNCVTL